jgi:phosphosulfolactate phosphohydrolase-like enzyme
MNALADPLFRTRPRKLLLICAGAGEDFTLEGALGGGALLAHLPDDDLSDSAILVRSIYERNNLEEWLMSSGRLLQKMGRGAGPHRCARLSIFNVVGQLRGKAIVPLEP